MHIINENSDPISSIHFKTQNITQNNHNLQKANITGDLSEEKRDRNNAILIEDRVKRKISEYTNRGAFVDTFKGDNGGQNEHKWQQKRKNEDGMEQRAVGNVAGGDLDLHQISASIAISSAAARRYRYTSHAR